MGKFFISKFLCENSSYFESSLIYNIWENAKILVYYLHWHSVSFTVKNTPDLVTIFGESDSAFGSSPSLWNHGMSRVCYRWLFSHHHEENSFSYILCEDMEN